MRLTVLKFDFDQLRFPVSDRPLLITVMLGGLPSLITTLNTVFNHDTGDSLQYPSYGPIQISDRYMSLDFYGNYNNNKFRFWM